MTDDLSPTTLSRLRESLSSALSNAKTMEGSNGISHVMQKPSGAVFTDKSGAWTFRLADARGFQSSDAPLNGTKVVPFEAARAVLIDALVLDLAETNALLRLLNAKEAPNG